jgi:hypothetical protein
LLGLLGVPSSVPGLLLALALVPLPVVEQKECCPRLGNGWCVVVLVQVSVLVLLLYRAFLEHLSREPCLGLG